MRHLLLASVIGFFTLNLASATTGMPKKFEIVVNSYSPPVIGTLSEVHLEQANLFSCLTTQKAGAYGYGDSTFELNFGAETYTLWAKNPLYIIWQNLTGTPCQMQAIDQMKDFAITTMNSISGVELDFHYTPADGKVEVIVIGSEPTYRGKILETY